MFGPSARLAGARVVRTVPPPDLRFDLDAVRAAITPATRLVLLASPNNPTGVTVPGDDIRRLAAQSRPAARVFVDEAYADFAGHSVVGDIARTPNLVVGRTFAKAYGLAGMRIGCLVAQPGDHPAAARRHRAVQRERVRGRRPRGGPRGPRARRAGM